MNRVLFVTNGHGEAAIAERLAFELRAILPGVGCDHLALVGNLPDGAMNEVGPRRAMPSGGLIAMGNTRNLAQDVRAGLLSLTWAQAAFLRRARGAYDLAVAVGDVYGLAMTLLARIPTVFVGSAKSVEVAPYGAFEERILARAAACFVRDEATADALREHGVRSEVGNAIVDLFTVQDDPSVERATVGFAPALALFPGSRERAYSDAAFLLEVTYALATRRAGLGAVLSIARGLDAERFSASARGAGWDLRPTPDASIPFALQRGGREIVRAWRGALGPLLSRVVLVLGQAGTANEAAAAAAVPVVAFEREGDGRARWYRRRQQGLLAEALVVVRGDVEDAISAVSAILDDEPRRLRMGEIGRTRMGEAGGSRRIAERIVTLLTRS